MFEYQKIMIDEWVNLVEPERQEEASALVWTLVNDWGYLPQKIGRVDTLELDKQVNDYSKNDIVLYAQGIADYNLIGDVEIPDLLSSWGSRPGW